MDKATLPFQMISEVIGIPIKIVSNEFNEFHGNTHQKIIITIEEEKPDLFAFSILFTLSLMSFTFSAPRGYSEREFIPDEEWTLEYFLRALRFENGRLISSNDYVSGRHMKTDIIFEPGGRVILETRNRGKGAGRWILHLQGKKHIQPI